MSNIYSVNCSILFAGMLDLNIPCNSIELHLLCEMFDPDKTEEVDYLELTEGLKHMRYIVAGQLINFHVNFK